MRKLLALALVITACSDGDDAPRAADGRGLRSRRSDRGPETTPWLAQGCPADGGIELWTMQGSAHIPVINLGFSDRLLTRMNARARP